MKLKLKRKNRHRDEAIEYLNLPSWYEDKDKISFKSKKKFDIPVAVTEKERLDQIEGKVEYLQPGAKKGKRKKVYQILFLIICSVVSIVLLAFTGDNGIDVSLSEIWDNIETSYLLLAFLLLFVVIFFDTLKYIYLTYVTTKKFRPFLSFKVGIVGRYYDSITPLATGGQPFQMFYLAKRDVPVGVATSIPLLKYFLGQIAVLLIALALMLFVPLESIKMGIDGTTLTATRAAAYVGLAINSFVPFFILFLTILPKLGKKTTSGIIKAGSKLKIVKNYETTYNKVITHVEEFQTSMRYVSSKIQHIFTLMLLTAIEYVAFISIPYAICLAFGAQPSWVFYMTILSLYVYTQFAVSLVPTPGTAGAAEALFLIMFKSLFPSGAFWAMLIWRFLTYYMFIILGLIVNFYDFIKQATKEKFIERRKLFNIREKLVPRLNSQTATERLANLRVLKQIENDDKFFIPKQREYDIKLSMKTEYSFMPFKPAYLAYKMHEAGCPIAGIMDYDTVAGCKEFYEACSILEKKCLLGVEVKTYISRTKKRNIRINNIYQPDIINLQMTCIPVEAIDKVNDWLKKFRDKRNIRNVKMVELINKKYRAYGISIKYEEDVLPLSHAEEGGSVTEWHLLYALSQKIIERFGRGQILLRFITQELGISLTEKMKQNLLDVTENKIYVYDLINVLKSEIKDFYLDASEECCSILEFLKIAKDIGSVVVYPYMGDIIQNIFGEYRVDKFEDSFIEELIKELKEIGVNAVSYEPSRLTEEQLNNIRQLCDKFEMMQISGETVYSVRQNFNSRILDEERFANLKHSAWALVGNSKAVETGKESGMFSPSTIEKYPQLSARIMIYSTLGKYGKLKENS